MEKTFEDLCKEGKFDEARELLKKQAEAKLCKIDDPSCESCQ